MGAERKATMGRFPGTTGATPSSRSPGERKEYGRHDTSETISLMHNISALVLDDDEFMLELMQTMLHELGVTQVRTFSSAIKALDALDVRTSIQLAICDLNMPGMDGVELMRYLAKSGYGGAIIIMSGEDPRTLQTVLNLGRAHNLRLLGVLSKPVDRQALVHLLGRVPSDSTTAQSEGGVLLSASELREGLADRVLVPYFQPQVDIHTRQVVGVEALARWRHPKHGILGPQAFISVAEESGLINALTDSMITQSMQQWREWRDVGYDMNISVNLSMDCLSRLEFPEQIVIEAMSAGMPIDQLILEITESRLMQNIIVSLDVLSRLCLKRVRLSIDDFGTAYSNMEKLQMLPFSELKIDRVFVDGAAHNASIRAILESSAALGKRLGMRIVAEGVETREDWQCVAAAGCDVVQGYYVAHPMPGDAFVDWMQGWK